MTDKDFKNIDEIKRIVSVSGASIQINDLDDYSHVSTISVKGQSFGTAIDPKLNQLYSINTNPDYFSIIDLNTNNVIKNIYTHIQVKNEVLLF